MGPAAPSVGLWGRWCPGCAARPHHPVADRSARNAAYSAADYLLSPLLMIGAAPFLVARLGLAQYGIWMLVNALVGTAAVVPMGLGDATVKFVSSYRAPGGGGGEHGVVRVVRSTLTVSALLGLLVAAIVITSAPWLAGAVFKIAAHDRDLAVRAIQLAGVGLVIRSIDSVFLSTLRGYERYDLAAGGGPGGGDCHHGGGGGARAPPPPGRG